MRRIFHVACGQSCRRGDRLKGNFRIDRRWNRKGRYSYLAWQRVAAPACTQLDYARRKRNALVP